MAPNVITVNVSATFKRWFLVVYPFMKLFLLIGLKTHALKGERAQRIAKRFIERGIIIKVGK